MAQIQLPATSTTPRRARRFLADVFPSSATARLEDAKLLVSELVSNAVVQAVSPVELRVSDGPGTMRVEVHDRSGSLPILAQVPLSAERGRGLAIVDRVADRWGVDRSPGGGKAVWFELNI